MHHALEEAPKGSILVIEVEGKNPKKRALLGDVIGYVAKKKGLGGVVTNGVVRDFNKLFELGFPVYCGGVNMNGPGKREEGERGGSVVVGGVVVRSRDVVVGDSDGVVVVRGEEVGEVVERALERGREEEEKLGRLEGGESTLVVYCGKESVK